MAVISFGHQPDQVWGGSGWAVRQVLKDLKPYAEGNAPLLAALADAEHLGYLGVEHLDPELRRTVIEAVREMCLGIISGVRPSTITESVPGDRVAHELYARLIEDLLALAKSAERRIG